MNRDSGFTLIELVVAIAVAAVATGFVIVSVDGWSTRQALASSARRLGNVIRLYREKAQGEDESYTVRLELDRGDFTVSRGGETVRKGRLGPGQRFAKVWFRSAGVDEEVRPPITLPLTPRGLLPEIWIRIESAAGEGILVGIESLVNEVHYVTSEKELKNMKGGRDEHGGAKQP